MAVGNQNDKRASRDGSENYVLETEKTFVDWCLEDLSPGQGVVFATVTAGAAAKLAPRSGPSIVILSFS